METASCVRCGSDDLRKKHARTSLRRLYRSVTGQQRYACNACHHRGWTDLLLPERDAQGQRVERSHQGRPIEHRDIVAKRQASWLQTLFFASAVLLGSLIAGLIGWACG